jgi:hypothetical protein
MRDSAQVQHAQHPVREAFERVVSQYPQVRSG